MLALCKKTKKNCFSVLPLLICIKLDNSHHSIAIMNDPIQARVSNGIYAPVPKPKTTQRRKQPQSISADSLDLLLLYILMSLPVLFTTFMIKMSAGDSRLLMEFHNLPVSQCHVHTANYTITPQVFNTTLMYFPAELNMPVMVHSTSNTPDEHLEISAATFTIPTKMEVEFRCPDGPPKYKRGECEYMVGETLAKYQELQQLTVFPCYVKDGKVVGTKYDYDEYLMPAYNQFTVCNYVIYTIITGIACILTGLVYVAAPMRHMENE